MIIGTAGHIDHGKTTLVRALTGVDADRLPEEKARGLTIDLGYAYATLTNGVRVGFVDVPGHERFIRNMLAGATGIDGVMLVVAADDGVMPQTREHLAILNLVGISRGLVAVTKTDRADADRLAAVTGELRALLADTSLAGADIFPCSAASGQGLDAIHERLRSLAAEPSRHAAAGYFRLAVDRSFTIAGAGTVVTGTVYAGSVQAGDRVTVSPAGLTARVRAIRSQDQSAEAGGVGQRCALNLAGTGISKDAVQRGDWVAAPELHAPTARLGVRLRLLPDAPPLAQWAAVQLHLAAAFANARVSLLEGETLKAGEDAIALLALDRPVGALRGDRFVIRDPSAKLTLGGGRVLDPFAPPRSRRRAEAVRRLVSQDQDSPARALQGLLAATPAGVDLAAFARAWNLRPDAAEAVEQAAETVRLMVGGTPLGLSARRMEGLSETALAGLSAFHRGHPDSPGPTLDELVQRLPEPDLRPVHFGVVRRLVAEGAIERKGTLLRLPGHAAKLSEADDLVWQDVSRMLAEAGVTVPRAAELAERLGLEADELVPVLDRLWRMGKLHKVPKGYFLLPAVASALAQAVERVAEAEAGVATVGRLREETGVGRHLALPLLEYFDKVGFTRRINRGRRVKQRWSEVFPNEAR